MFNSGSMFGNPVELEETSVRGGNSATMHSSIAKAGARTAFGAASGAL